jgi:serine/threonine protein phosphatase PrpC
MDVTAAEQAATALPCPVCGQPVWPGDNFCESCRAEIAPARVSGDFPVLAPGGSLQCPYCPGAPVGQEGYCESCGRKVPAAADHSEIDLGLLAGMTDLGRRHPRNEDAMALAVTTAPGGPTALAVVCDGVSTSSRPDEAARDAARAAIRVLLTAARAGQDMADGSRQAFAAARDALLVLADGSLNAPSATFVSAVVTAEGATLCWLGDSRAYWLDDAASRQLTTDDSVATELVARGLPEEEALASPAGHVVTGWVGADLSEAEPHVTEFVPPGPGIVLLCSDGLWNYQPDPEGLAALALPAAHADPLGAASKLVAFANEAGGRDNVTAVLVPFPPRASEHPGSSSATARIAHSAAAQVPLHALTAPEEAPSDEPAD